MQDCPSEAISSFDLKLNREAISKEKRGNVVFEVLMACATSRRPEVKQQAQ